MEPRVNLVTLGVRDLARVVAFYRDLWTGKGSLWRRTMALHAERETTAMRLTVQVRAHSRTRPPARIGPLAMGLVWCALR